MFIVASYCCFVFTMSIARSNAHAFFTAPGPDFVRSLSVYNVNGSKRVLPGAESNEVSMRGSGINSNEDDEETEEEEENEGKESDQQQQQQQRLHRADEPEGRGEEHTVVLVEFESEPSERDGKDGNKGGKEDNSESQSPLDPWSIVWYIGSFGGLVAFFLIVSCSEWCCRRGARPLNTPYVQRGAVTGDQLAGGAGVTETPPPPYHLFAPPPYDSVNYGELLDKTSGEKIDIFVISVPIPSTTHQPAPA